MKTCLNGATTMSSSVELDIAVAAEAGFAAVELWWPKVATYAAQHGLPSLRSMLAGNGLQVASLCPLTIWPFRDTEAAREAFRAAVEAAPQLGCELVIACPDFRPARLSREAALDIHARELAAMAHFAADHGVRLAIEPISRHSLVPGPTEALALIDRAGGLANVGVVVDTFHYFRSQVSAAEIAAVPLESIAIVHVNDTEDGAIDELTDANRVYPTEGVIPFVDILGGIVARGYDGVFSVELFRPEYWQQAPAEVARRSMRSLAALGAEIGAH